MSLQFDFEKELAKVESKCIENDLMFTFEKVSFPIIATIEPSEDKKNQMVMDFGDGESNFVNGKIQLIFGDELIVKVDDFYIEDGLLNGIKNAAKKVHYLYLQMYFKEFSKTTREEI